MVSRKSQLKKFKISELKEIIRQHDLGSTKGKKSDLLERVGTHEKFKSIKSSLVIPTRVRKPPTERQIAARKKFQEMVFKRHGKIKLKQEDVQIKELKSLPQISIKEITKPRKKKSGRRRPPASERQRTPRHQPSQGLSKKDLDELFL